MTLDTESCVLYREKEPIELFSVEYRIMYMFMNIPEKYYKRADLSGWMNEEYMDDDNTCYGVCISKLRQLSNDGSKYIKTVRGLGYRLEK